MPNAPDFQSPTIPVVRLLVSSYLVAGVFGIVPGTDFTVLTDPLVQDDLGEAVATMTILTLGYLVMSGQWLRVTTLSLALLTFWACYLRTISNGFEIATADFWRDVVLVAGLLASCALPKTLDQMGRSTPSGASAARPQLSKEELRAIFSADLDGRGN